MESRFLREYENNVLKIRAEYVEKVGTILESPAMADFILKIGDKKEKSHFLKEFEGVKAKIEACSNKLNYKNIHELYELVQKLDKSLTMSKVSVPRDLLIQFKNLKSIAASVNDRMTRTDLHEFKESGSNKKIKTYADRILNHIEPVYEIVEAKVASSKDKISFSQMSEIAYSNTASEFNEESVKIALKEVNKLNAVRSFTDVSDIQDFKLQMRNDDALLLLKSELDSPFKETKRSSGETSHVFKLQACEAVMRDMTDKLQEVKKILIKRGLENPTQHDIEHALKKSPKLAESLQIDHYADLMEKYGKIVSSLKQDISATLSYNFLQDHITRNDINIYDKDFLKEKHTEFETEIDNLHAVLVRHEPYPIVFPASQKNKLEGDESMEDQFEDPVFLIAPEALRKPELQVSRPSLSTDSKPEIPSTLSKPPAPPSVSQARARSLTGAELQAAGVPPPRRLTQEEIKIKLLARKQSLASTGNLPVVKPFKQSEFVHMSYAPVLNQLQDELAKQNTVTSFRPGQKM